MVVTTVPDGACYIVSWTARDIYPTPELEPYIVMPTVPQSLTTIRRVLAHRGKLGQWEQLSLVKLSHGWRALVGVQVDPLTYEPIAETLAVLSDDWMVSSVSDRVSEDDIIACQEACPINATQFTAHVVRYMRRYGCVPVRKLGGAYFVPTFARGLVDPLVDAMSQSGVQVRCLMVDSSTRMLADLTRDAIEVIKEMIAVTKQEIAKAKTRASRDRKLKELHQLKAYLRGYHQLVGELVLEIEEQDEPEATLDLLADLMG